MRPIIVISSKAGQLGNRLFNFTNFIAFAAEHGATVINPSFDEYAELFETTRRDLLCRYPAKRFFSMRFTNARTRRLLYRLVSFLVRVIKKLGFWKRVATVVTASEGDLFLLDDNPKAIDVFRNSRIVFVSGLQFRDVTSITKHGDEIRAYFKPVETHAEAVDSLLRNIRQNCEVLVGVHIRRGDYADHLGGRYSFEVKDYVRIIDRLKALFPGRKTGFLVCSNERLNRDLFKAANCFFGSGHFLEDMYALARCDYIVGPPSTFSLWASFYGQVPLCFLQRPDEPLALADFVDYYSHFAGKTVYQDHNGEQYVLINGARYGLVFPTKKSHLAL